MRTGPMRVARLAAVVGLAAVIFGACSGSGGGSNDAAQSKLADNGGAAAGRPQSTVVGTNDAAAAAPQPADAGAPLPAGLGEAKVVKTASIDVEVTKGGFDAAFSKVPT